MTESDNRLNELKQWLTTLELPNGCQIESIRPASSDASFRRYFRVDTDDQRSLIIMDAPPPHEDCAPFVHAATVMRQAGVCVPQVYEQNLERGFLVLSDLGNTTMLARLHDSPDQADPLYRAASAQLIALQQASAPDVFPAYNREVLLRELRLFDEWYLRAHLQISLSEAENEALTALYEKIVDNNLAQPRVYVHRDWHSRNLMVLNTPDNPSALPNLAVIDFQDALFGPVTYDLVSLLRDAYVDWPEDQQIDWAARYWDAARQADIPVQSDFGDFYRDFEWMGMQRHLKVLGIFARLACRDNKLNYLDDMPRVLHYVKQTARRYREFAPLVALIRRLDGVEEKAAFTF